VPELPDITVYIEALEKRILGQTLERVQITGLSLLRTARPPISSVEGKKVLQLRRIGKRIAIGLEDNLWLVLHLMIAGRLHWHEGAAKVPKSRTLANSSLQQRHTFSDRSWLTKTRVAATWCKAKKPSAPSIQAASRCCTASLESFAAALQSENHTLKRALTDPQLFSGIGNAYSDEILFAAQLSPTALTKKLTASEMERLFNAVRDQMVQWTERLRAGAGDKFPEKVTAFRPEMAVHGRYKQPCPRCGGKIQRIRYAANETNYCPNCQTGGKLLADRSLSRLLRQDWPKNAEDLEDLTAPHLRKSV
jgi:formamidopyrimidine-DNA glycosylase